MDVKKIIAKKGIIFWVGFLLGSILAGISIWYVASTFLRTHDAEFASLAMIPTALFVIALILSLISKKAGAIAYAFLFALVLASSLTQGFHLVLYIIPAWLFLTGSFITISIFEA